MSFEHFLGAVAEAEAAQGCSQKELERVIDEIVGMFKDPVVLYPGGWEDTLPTRVWEMIHMERMMQQMKAKGKKIEESTHAEALAYLYSASVVAPIGNEWTNIYLWLGRDLLPKGAESFAPKELSREEQDYLTDLKRWIQRRKTSGRKRHVVYPNKLVKKRRKVQVGCPDGPEIIEIAY